MCFVIQILKNGKTVKQAYIGEERSIPTLNATKALYEAKASLEQEGFTGYDSMAVRSTTVNIDLAKLNARFYDLDDPSLSLIEDEFLITARKVNRL